MSFRAQLVAIALLATTVLFQNCADDGSLESYYDSSSTEDLTSVPAVDDFSQSDMTIQEGDPLSLAVVASGGSLKYEWFKDGEPIDDEEDFIYTISETVIADSGVYTVEASNDKGAIDVSVNVTVVAPTPPPPPPPPAKPVCSVWYQARNDSGIGVTAKDGAYSLYSNGTDKDCNDSYCGIRMGVACTAGDEIRLKYQYKFFSVAAPEITSPWSGLDGNIRWGAFSALFVTGSAHPKEECRAPLLCGIRVEVETKTGQACNIYYRFQAEGQFSLLKSNGDWSYLPDMGGRDDNCKSGPCGMKAELSCP